MCAIRHPDSFNLAGSQQPSQVDGIPSIGFDPNTRPDRHDARRNDDAGVSGLHDLAMQAIAAWSGLIAEMKIARFAR